MKTRNICALCLVVLLVFAGCSSVKGPSLVIDKIIKTPGVYIETLKHPTEFPEEYLPEVLDVDEILVQNKLGEDEIVKMLLLGESKLSSTHFVQVSEDGEMKQHFHKKHDKTVSVKKGKGIAILNGTRYLVKPGTVLQVPSGTRYKFINTGGEIFVALSVFTPPFNGEDITYVKEEMKDKVVSEAQKEKEKIEKKKKKGKIVVKKDEAEKQDLKDDTNKDLYKPKKIIKLVDEDKGFSKKEIKHNSLYDSVGREPKKERTFGFSEAVSNNVNELKTSNIDQGLEYDYDLDKKIDGKEPIRNTNDDEFSIDKWETLAEETDFSGNPDQYLFEEVEETKSDESAYESEKEWDLIDRMNKKETSEVFQYATDDPFADMDEPFVEEEIEGF